MALFAWKICVLSHYSYCGCYWELQTAVSLLFFTEEFAFFSPYSRIFWSQLYPFISSSKLNVFFSVLAICFSFHWRWRWNSCALPQSVRKEGPDTPGARTCLLWCYTIPQNTSCEGKLRQPQASALQWVKPLSQSRRGVSWANLTAPAWQNKPGYCQQLSTGGLHWEILLLHLLLFPSLIHFCKKKSRFIMQEAGI